jgi:hypothetical protein
MSDSFPVDPKKKKKVCLTALPWSGRLLRLLPWGLSGFGVGKDAFQATFSVQYQLTLIDKGSNGFSSSPHQIFPRQIENHWTFIAL